MTTVRMRTTLTFSIYFQLIHFQVCEILFLTGAQRATYLYTLMFYNVVSYCASYAREMITRWGTQWSNKWQIISDR